MGNDQRMICWLFDSGKIANSFYGEEVFSLLFEQKCLFENEERMVFSSGDILDANIASDCSQIAIRDELCTISNLPEISIDLVYAVVVEGIEEEIACKVDRAFSAHKAYFGMTSIDIGSTDPRKQFWKSLCRSFSLHRRKLTVFGSEEAGVAYQGIAEERGIEVCFSEDDEAWIIDDISLDWDCHHSKSKPNSNRGRLEMNFALVKEVEVAGAQIWRSVKDFDRVKVRKDSPVGENNIGYLFMAFYQAAQGIERLQKILIELMIKSHPPKEKDLERIEQFLHSHNHIKLHDYIEEDRKTCINMNDRRFFGDT